MNLIEKLLKQEKMNIDSARRVECEKRLNIYDDNYNSILKSEVDKQFHKQTKENVKQMVDNSSNTLKRIVNEISLVYLKNAKRSYMIGETENVRYQAILDNLKSDIIMQEINRLTNVCNESLIYVVPRNKMIDYDILTPDQVEVFQAEDNPTKPAAILFTNTLINTVDNTDIYKTYWDIYGHHKILDANDQVVQDYGNPYIDPDNKGQTILPFVIFHKKYPRKSIWNITSGNDLISGTLQIGVLLTYLNYLIKVGSFKMLLIKGINTKDIPKDLIFDPLFPKVINNKDNPQAGMEVIDFQMVFDKVWEIICSKIGALANNYGLSMDNFRLVYSAESGFALKIKNQGLEKAVNEQVKHYRYYEKELFNVTKIVNNTMYKEKIAENGIFKIDFTELEYPENPDIVRKEWAWNLKMGIKSIYDLLMFINPDIKSQKDAEAVIKMNTDINKDIQEKYGIEIDKLIDEALQDKQEKALI